MPDQSEAPIVRPHLDDILQAWEGGTMDAAGTIEDLVERIDEAAEIIRLCEEAFVAIANSAAARDVKWSGMTARDIALWGIAQIKGQNP